MTHYRPIQTEAEFHSRIVLGQTQESLTLDFKKDLGAWDSDKPEEKRKAQKELCRDIAQFANTFGGTLLLGIEEIAVNGIKTAGTIHSLTQFDARREWIEAALQNFLEPRTLTKVIDRIQIDQATVIAVNVPPSERLVSVWDPKHGTIECLYRNNHGKARMNPAEMEAHMTNTARRVALALHRVRDTLDRNDVELASGLWTYRNSGPGEPTSLRRISEAKCFLGQVGEHDFELQLSLDKETSARSITVPFGLLREAWLTSDRKIGVFLHTRVIIARGGGLTLDPV